MDKETLKIIDTYIDEINITYIIDHYVSNLFFTERFDKVLAQLVRYHEEKKELERERDLHTPFIPFDFGFLDLTPPPVPEINYKTLTCKRLRRKCREHGLVGFNKFRNRKKLIQFMKDNII